MTEPTTVLSRSDEPSNDAFFPGPTLEEEQICQVQRKWGMQLACIMVTTMLLLLQANPTNSIKRYAVLPSVCFAVVLFILSKPYTKDKSTLRYRIIRKIAQSQSSSCFFAAVVRLPLFVTIVLVSAYGFCVLTLLHVV